MSYSGKDRVPEHWSVQQLVEEMRANGGTLIPDEPIPYELTQQAIEHLEMLNRGCSCDACLKGEVV